MPQGSSAWRNLGAVSQMVPRVKRRQSTIGLTTGAPCRARAPACSHDQATPVTHKPRASVPSVAR